MDQRDQVIEIVPDDNENTITQVPLRNLLIDDDRTREIPIPLQLAPPPVTQKSSHAAILNTAALQKAMTSCRRQVIRVPVAGPIMILDHEGGLICKGTGHNISPKGIGAKIYHRKKRIEVGQTVVLEIYGTSRLKPFRAEAEVMNLYSRNKQGRLAYWGIGLRWTSLSVLVGKLLEDYSRVAGGMGGFDSRERV